MHNDIGIRLKRSELGHKQKEAKNPTSEQRSVTAPKSSANPKSVTPKQRVREFPGQTFKVSAGKLYYCTYREEVGLKKSIVTCHVAPVNHVNSKAKEAAKVKREGHTM